MKRIGSVSKRPVVLVDLDNVVYDFVYQFATWLNMNGALDTRKFTYKDNDHIYAGQPERTAMGVYRDWEIWNNWGIPKGEFIRWWRLGIEAEEIYAKGPLIAGARDALWKLSDNEWDIHICTSRLTKFGLHDQIILNTASWLRDNNIPYRNIHFTDNKASIRAAAIIDDRDDNMDAESHDLHFWFPANHNQGRLVTAAAQREAWEEIVNKLAT